MANNLIITADFETIKRGDRVEVWLADVYCLEEDKHTSFYNIADFTNYLLSIKTKQKVYFHNLRYDGNFLVNHLLKIGWQYDEKPNKKKKKFFTLIGSMSEWYMIKIGNVTVVDSLKLIPLSAAEIAITFKLDVKKGVIDYKKSRPEGYIPIREEMEYVFNDTEIIAKAIKFYRDKGLTKLTLASNALNSYKYSVNVNYFTILFPKISDEEDEFIRDSYRGGFTYCNPSIKGKLIPKSCSYDVNSMYPACMLYDKLPHGIPKFFEGEYTEDKKYPLYVIRFNAEFKLKPKHVPTILQSNGRFYTNNYYTKSNGIITLTLTSIDFEVFKKHYDISFIEFYGGYKFKAKAGLFQNYIYEWKEEKENSTGGKRFIAKRMLNSLYGKFATRKYSYVKIPHLEDDKLCFTLSEKQELKPVYLPVSAFITSYARVRLMTVIQDNYDRFLYCDTDSIHFTGWKVPKLAIHDTLFGKWGFEGNYTKAKYLRAKTYICETTDGGKKNIKIRVAGLPKSARQTINFENFKEGARYSGKLQQKIIKGGVELIETTYKIKKR